MPKNPRIPSWLKKQAFINPGTLGITSLNLVGVSFVKGVAVGFDAPLQYDSGTDRWLQASITLSQTIHIDVHFTFQNTSRRTLSGFVTGFIDQTPLSQFPVASLADKGSVSGAVSFKPTHIGDFVITLMFREPVHTPTPQQLSRVLATAGANYTLFYS